MTEETDYLAEGQARLEEEAAEDMSIGERSRRLDRSLEALAEGGADEEDSETGDDLASDEEAVDSDSGVDVVLNAIETQESLLEQREKERAEFNALVEANLPGYQPPPEEALSRYEEAGMEIGRLDPSSAAFGEMMELLRGASEERERAARADTDGFDSDGAPVVERFDPMTLDSAAFSAFARAVAAGGAIGTERVPDGFTREQWSQAVASNLQEG